jgi:anti-sigma factor ChrR (cupin superfamily)
MRIPGLHLDESIASLDWRPTRDPGVSWFPLHLADEESSGTRRGAATVLIRMEPGSRYTPHRHLGTEDVLVLHGGFRDRWGEYRQGEHVHYPPGSVHAPVALGDAAQPSGPANPACILYASVPLGIELVE